MLIDEVFMQEALLEAKRGAEKGEVPVGAVLVFEDKIIARAHNCVEEQSTALAHAEILCLKQGSELLNNWRLLGTTLYCTLEPCPMCAGAMIHSRIKRLVWGAQDTRCGSHGGWIDLLSIKHPIHNFEVASGVLADCCADEMRNFFKKRRDVDRALKAVTCRSNATLSP